MWTVFPCVNHPCGQLPPIFGFFQIPFRMQERHRASNEPLTSIFGDTIHNSPNTEVRRFTQPAQTSTIGDKSRIRRTRRIHARKTGPKTPSSATHQPTRRTRQLDHPKTGSQTSVFGAPVTTRRRRKLQVRNSARNEKGLGTSSSKTFGERVGDAARTRDLLNHNQGLYLLSYAHHRCCC